MSLMKGLSKADTLALLEAHGMNTVERVVVKKPFVAESIIGKIISFSHEVISLRSWRRGKVLSPFYPNCPVDKLLQIINDNWDSLKVCDEIIISEGINPDNSLRAGKIIDGETSMLIEYFNGPGTVRKLDKIQPLIKTIPKTGSISLQSLDDWFPLCLAAKTLFRSYPGHIIEWSKYPYKIGKKKEHYIYWEVI